MMAMKAGNSHRPGALISRFSPFPLFAFSPFRPAIFRPSPPSPIRPAPLPAEIDGLIILGAPLNPQGEPGRVGRLRLLHALELWRRHYPARPFIITGGQLPGTAQPEARAMAAWSCSWVAANWGPELQEQLRRCLLLEEASRNTAASARHTLVLAQELGLRAVGLVSDTFHLPRAHFLFRRHFSRHAIRVHPLPARGLLQQYWRHRRYLWLTRIALREAGAWVKVLAHLCLKRNQ